MMTINDVHCCSCRDIFTLVLGASTVAPGIAQAGSPIGAGGKVKIKGGSSKDKKKDSQLSGKAQERLEECAIPRYPVFRLVRVASAVGSFSHKEHNRCCCPMRNT